MAVCISTIALGSLLLPIFFSAMECALLVTMIGVVRARSGDFGECKSGVDNGRCRPGQFFQGANVLAKKIKDVWHT